MTDAEDLARRYLVLWQDYVAALLADLTTPEVLRHWLADRLEPTGHPKSGDQSMHERDPGPEPAAGTAAAPGPSRERDDALADLACRLARIEERVAALERGRRPVARARGRGRGARR